MLTGGFTEGSRQQTLLDDIRNTGHLFSGSLMALWPLRAGRCGAEAEEKDPEPELRQMGCAGSQYVVSETNSEKIVMLSLNDSPMKRPQQNNNFVKAKQKQRPIRGDLQCSVLIHSCRK